MNTTDNLRRVMDKEVIENLIIDLENNSIRSTKGLIQIDTGKYEEEVYRNSVYARVSLDTGGVCWTYYLYFRNGVTTGVSKTLKEARNNSLNILKNKLERHGN